MSIPEIFDAMPGRYRKGKVSKPSSYYFSIGDMKVNGVIPKEVPEGTDHLTYMAHAAAAKVAAPEWSKEDMFVV